MSVLEPEPLLNGLVELRGVHCGESRGRECAVAGNPRRRCPPARPRLRFALDRVTRFL